MTVPHPHPLSLASYSAVELLPDNQGVVLLDQRRLPELEHYLVLRSVEAVAAAIEELVVRGAPALGLTAAYAMVLAAGAHGGAGAAALEAAARRLRATRPTAVNLAFGVDAMLRAAREPEGQGGLVEHLAERARDLHRADVAACRALGELGSSYLPEGAVVLTHCNAGALATGGFGTALGVVRAAHERGKLRRVLVDETRPVLQGSRLSAWELHRDGIDAEVITDSMAAGRLARGEVDAVVVGADRIAANGDVANKIGTYGLACLARFHGLPFYVAAPWSTVDLACPGGDAIPIEQRAESELRELGGRRLVPEGVKVDNPAFDVTPAELVTAIFTERGVVQPVRAESLLVLGAAEPRWR